MKKKDFYFDLPRSAIAQRPAEKRGDGRLMLLERAGGKISHRMVRDLPDIIPEIFGGNALLVFNDSRVRKARIFGFERGQTGSKNPREFLLLRSLDGQKRLWSVITKTSKTGRGGRRIFTFAEGLEAELKTDAGNNCTLFFERAPEEAYIEKHGHIPLPPYIRREDGEEDEERYQTVYSKETGSAAAPTAGLHFSLEILEELKRRGIESAFLTLHVGTGTFLPVRTENLEDHKMHSEYYFIEDGEAEKIDRAKDGNRKIIAVGTTSLRTLEAAFDEASGKIRRGAGVTDIFIYGNYKFRVPDALFTNFHTPESTLLALASSFCAAGGDADAGRLMLLGAYKNALDAGYKFFSYGDAMLIV